MVILSLVQLDFPMYNSWSSKRHLCIPRRSNRLNLPTILKHQTDRC